MSRRCTVCTHPDAHDINLVILRGNGSKRGIARKFGVSDDALDRHARNHLSEQLAGFRVRSAQDLQQLDEEFKLCLVDFYRLTAELRDRLAQPGTGYLTTDETWRANHRCLDVLGLVLDVLKHAHVRHGAELDKLLVETRQQWAFFKGMAAKAEIDYEPAELAAAILAGFPRGDYSDEARAVIEHELQRLAAGQDTIICC
ncbi:MAG TPA: hypothetical protein VJ464_01740 [Blastocatellia bacterium]|nr:hypothetical protein [Blastocatellia bacterium]